MPVLVLTAASVAIPMWQAIPKGGWWLRTMCYVTEQHLRIGRAVLGLVYADEEQPSPSKVFDDVMYGRFPQASYVYLNALMASIFADAAITEHQQGRRVHRTDSTGTTLPLPRKSAFAANKPAGGPKIRRRHVRYQGNINQDSSQAFHVGALSLRCRPTGVPRVAEGNVRDGSVQPHFRGRL